jgi:hypothetical protein
MLNAFPYHVASTMAKFANPCTESGSNHTSEDDDDSNGHSEDLEIEDLKRLEGHLGTDLRGFQVGLPQDAD